MPEQLIHLRLSTPVKVILILTVLIALFASWFVVRWYLGNTLADYFNPEEAELETARMAVSLAPKDPLPHWRLGNLVQKKLSLDQISVVVAEYEKAVSLSPHDYRFWMELGGALEQAGEYERAEKALREAVRLAPSYAYPRWYLGNLLLRTGSYEEAFSELQRASEANGELQPQLFNLAWQVNKDDFEALKASIGNTARARAQFSQYLLVRGRFDEGLRLWNSLTETEKRSNRAAADSIVATLITAKKYHQAMGIWNEVAPGLVYRADFGWIIDGGFEENLSYGSGTKFGWQVPSVPLVQIGITPTVGHSGSRSLRIFFQVRSHLDAISVTQLVPVKPNTEYDFECYLKTEKLVSAATPLVLIKDAIDETDLAASESAPNGTNNWQPIFLAFRTGAKSEAVSVTVIRTSCPDSPVCPIFGTVWYDDFNLKARK